MTSTESCYSEQDQIQPLCEKVIQFKEKVEDLENVQSVSSIYVKERESCICFLLLLQPKPPPYDSIMQKPPQKYQMYSDVITYHKLGSGFYGTTYQVSSNGKFLAGKILHSKLISSAKADKLDMITEQFKNECSFLFQIQHPNLVKFVGIYEDVSYILPMMLYEREAENLNMFIKRAKDTLAVFTKVCLSHDMAKGLDYLHTDVQIVHKNLHASNILVSRSGQAKISDYAMPHIVNFDEVYLPTEDNLVYAAPEVLENYQNTSYQSDIFSLGILNLQLVTEVSPFVGNYKEVQQEISKYEPLHNIIQGCLNRNVTNRPTASVVCLLLEEARRSPTTVAYDSLNSKVRM